MKRKQIPIVLVALSLMAVMLISSVNAAITYSVIDTVNTTKKPDRIVIITIDTTSDGTNGPFDGTTVDPSSIVITIFNKKGEAAIVDPSTYSVVLDVNKITITSLAKVFPKKAEYHNVVGNVGSLGNTFFATGPGWGYRWG